MEESRATSRYAKACRECATTKAKCIRPAAGQKCERCARLNKECRARVTPTRAPRPPKPNRISQMEQKLDGLVTLLAASQAKEQPSAAPNLQPFLTPNSLSPDNGLNDFGASQSPFVAVVPLEEKTQKCSCSESTIQEALSGDNVIGIIITGPKYQCDLGGRSCTVLDLNDEVAAALLDNYRASMSKYFPFVVIPTSINVQLLRTSKPFLYLSVMAVSSYQKTGQHATLSTEIMKRLSEQMLLRGEKTLDLLQGVLVCAEWYQSHRFMDSQLTNILQLSVALLVDLGLNKAPCTSDKHQIVTDTTKMFHGNSAYSQVRTNDERRAFLGCFYLTSIISSCFKKLDALRYTVHVEESCNALAQNPEYESDIYLVQLLRLQQIAEQITQALPCDAPQSFWTSKPPIGLLVKAFQTDLQSFKLALPPTLQQDAPMLQHLQSNEIHLYEISLCDWSCHPSPHPNPNPPTQRLETLNSALLATHAFITTFLSLPISQYSSFPFATWAQTLHAMQVLTKLSLLSDVPGWDLSYVREVVDFSALLEQLTQRFEDSRIAEEAAQREQLAAGKGGAVGSRYELYVQRMRRVRGWYEQKLRGVLHGEEGGVGLRSQDREEDGDVSNDCMQSGFRDDFLTGSMLDDMEDAYWHDFLGEWGSF